MLFSGSEHQDALNADPDGTTTGGEQSTSWGGDAGGFSRPRMDDPNSGYNGGWTVIRGDGYEIPVPNDPVAYEAATKRRPSARKVDVERYRNMGAAAAQRQAYQINNWAANTSQASATSAIGRANDDRALAGQARGDQAHAVGLQRSAALGQQPSRAELLGRTMIDQSLDAQLAGAASARGGAMAQAAAQRQAAQGGAAFRQQGMQQLSAMRADEMDRARGAYFAGASGMRGMDYAGADQAVRMGGAYAQIGAQQAQQAQAQAQVETNQRRLNQEAQMGYERNAFDTNIAALNAGMGRATMMQQGEQFTKQMDVAERQRDEDRAAAIVQGGATTTTELAKRAEGGPVKAGKPYMVGERGPELVVPKHDGIVIPAEQTPAYISMYEPPGKYLQQSLDGHGYLADEDYDDGRPRLASRGEKKKPSLAKAAAEKSRVAPKATQAKTRPLTPDELRAAADKMEAAMRAEHAARMAQGPQVRVAPSLMGGWGDPYAAAPAEQPRPSMGQAVALMGGRADPYAPRSYELAREQGAMSHADREAIPDPRLVREDPYR